MTILRWQNKESGIVESDFAPALRASGGTDVRKRALVKTLNTKDENGKEPPQQDRVYSSDGIMTALSAQLSGRFNTVEPQVKQLGNVMPTATRDNNKMEGGGREPMIQCVGNLNKGNSQRGRIYDSNGLSPSLCSHSDTGAGLEPKIIEPVAVEGVNRGHKDQNGRRFKEPGEPMFTLTKQDIHGVAYGIYPNASPEYQRPPLEGLSRCLKADSHPAGVIITEATKQGYAIAHEGDSINLAVPNSKTRRGRVGKGIANTLDTSCNQATLSGTRIRRLTPRECMRLQGVPDYITDKLISAGISDTQMYRAAGDAVSVPVVYKIAKKME